MRAAGLAGRTATERNAMSVMTAEARPRSAQRRYQLESGLGNLTSAERAERGKAARAEVPRESHALLELPRTGLTRWPCSRSSQQAGCQTWCRSGTAG